MMRLCALMVVASFVQDAGEPADGGLADLPVLRVGELVQGVIEDGDPSVETEALRRDGRYLNQNAMLGRDWRLDVDEAGTYHVDLRSHLFDAYLVLRDEWGDVITQDDDGGINLHSRVVVDLSPGQSIRVQACALHGRRGAFELSLHAGLPAPLQGPDRQRAEAEDFRQRLAVLESTFGAESLERAAALDTMGIDLGFAVRWGAGGWEEARALFERALSIREAALGPDDLIVAQSLNNLAWLLQEQRAYAEARPLYERALSIREAALGPDDQVVAQSLNSLAWLLEKQGAYAEARALHERALSIQEAAWGPDDPRLAWSLNGLAGLLTRQGAYAEARPLYERALSIREAAQGPDDLLVAQSLQDLARLLSWLGAYAEARPLFERALSIREAALGPDDLLVAESLHNLGNCLKGQGASAEARPLHERALSIREAALGPDDLWVARSLNSLAGLLSGQGAYAEARPLSERALSIREAALGPDDLWVALSLHSLAQVLSGQGAYAEARPLYERSLSIRETALGPYHPTVAVSLHNLVPVLVILGEKDATRDLLLRARASERRHRQQLLDGLSSSESHLYLAQIRWQLELRLSPSVTGEGASIQAYESLLEWKGQVLRSMVRTGETLGDGLSAADRRRLERLGTIGALLSRQSTTRFTDADLGGEAASRRLQQLIAERRNLERELSENRRDALPEAIQWSRVRAALPPASALVDLFASRVYQPPSGEDGELAADWSWSEPQITAWITRSDGDRPVRVDLGPAAEVEVAVKKLLARLVGSRGSSLASPTDPGEGVRRLVWEAIEPHLDEVTTVFVSPDGALATLPFEVLQDADGRYLVEDRSFVYLTDATRLVKAVEGGPGEAGRRLLAAGGVDYWELTGNTRFTRAELLTDANVAHVNQASVLPAAAGASSSLRGPWSDVWRDLPATVDEVGQLEARHRKASAAERREVLSGSSATEEAVKAAMPGAHVIHLATHGYFNPDGLPSLADAAARAEEQIRENPWQDSTYDVARRLEGHAPGLLSGLVFAGVNSDIPADRDDGYLTAEEIGWLDLSVCDLVVLSACDTGLGRAQSGEGLLGLRRAFQLAGAKTVISSLWPVGDQSTADLMDLFYGNLWQKGLGKHEALRAAQLEMLRGNRARHGHGRPETWGAFVLDGDWR